MKRLTPEQLTSLPGYTGIIDSHIHLDSSSYASDLKDCLQRAQQTGIIHMLLPSINEQSSLKILKLMQDYPQLSGALGLHPHQAMEFDHKQSPQLWRDLYAQARWSAIGETGLEQHYDFCPFEAQLLSLQAQLELAQETRLPAILHCRQAEEQLYRALLPFKGKIQGVVHCFTGTWEWARKFLDLGFYLGIGGLVTLPKASEVQQVAEKVPSDRFILETDGPYLSPIPFRGFRNESCLLPLVVDHLARIRQQSASDIVQQSSSNAIKLFKLSL